MKPDFAFVLDQSAWPAFLVDDSGMVRRANSSAVAVFGTVMEGEPSLAASVWSPANALTSEEYLLRLERSSASAMPLKFRVKGGTSAQFDTRVCAFHKDGKKYHLFQLFPETAAAQPPAPQEPRAVSTEPPRKPEAAPAPDALAQKQKLECALQLSRTVALDFNNALTTILGHTSLILSRIEPSHPWRASLVEVEKSAEKAAEIAQDLAEFSRQERDVRSQAPGNLNSVLRHAVDVFRTPELGHIRWDLQLERRLYTVVFDEAKMQQALVRVIENAVEALGPNGQICVRTLNHTFPETVSGPGFSLAPGTYVCVEVVDNGCGVPQDVLPRVFEPFFTTKSDPKHRGLGLAWVYGIVTNHGGVVAIISPPGQGTTVRLFLPAQQKIVRESLTKVDDLRGNQTILIVDDEEMLLNLGQTVLSAFGYKVLTANSGARALELFSQSPGQIDLVITDMVMPGMSGRELVDQLRRISPHVPILCTSGYVRPPGDGEQERYLRKPYTTQELLRRVKQLLLQPKAS